MTQPTLRGHTQPRQGNDQRDARREKLAQSTGEVCPPITLADIRHLAVIRVWPEAAELLGISKASAYRAAEEGTIPTLKVGRRLLVPVPRLLALLGDASAQPSGEAA